MSSLGRDASRAAAASGSLRGEQLHGDGEEVGDGAEGAGAGTKSAADGEQPPRDCAILRGAGQDGLRGVQEERTNKAHGRS